MNNVSCVDQLCSVKLARNVPNVFVQNLPVGARLNQFWETWKALGAGPKVVQILKEGYTHPFQTRPNLTRSPTILSCYVHPHLFKALPFGLSTAPLEFTVVTEEVKLMALQKGIRINQYLDDWLVWARSLSPAYTNTSSTVSGLRLASKHGQVGTGPQASFRLRRLPV